MLDVLILFSLIKRCRSPVLKPLEGIMDQADDNAAPSPPMKLAALRLLWNPLSPSLRSLLRALDLAPIYGLGLGRLDVARVEASWEMLEDDSTAHGFVLTLRDGRRCYLQYIAAYQGDDVDEEVQTLPMEDERYPRFNSAGGIVWDDDTEDLTRLFVD
jgi:hypothetical protein